MSVFGKRYCVFVYIEIVAAPVELLSLGGGVTEVVHTEHYAASAALHDGNVDAHFKVCRALIAGKEQRLVVGRVKNKSFADNLQFLPILTTTANRRQRPI